MKIDSITVMGFQCFGDPTTVKLSSSITALIGANGTGKTAFLEALLRLFGSRDQRNVRNTDFFVPPGGTLQKDGTKCLTIEAHLVFPELAQSGASAQAVAPCFRHMLVQEPGGQPFCRVRLEAAWTGDGTLEGSVEQKVCWISTAKDQLQAEDMHPMTTNDRALIQVNYVPAIRGASSQLMSATESMLGRLLRAAIWSEATRESVEQASNELRNKIGNEQAVQIITSTLTRRWGEVRDSKLNAQPEMQFIDNQFQDIIRHFNLTLRPSELNTEQNLASLSEGQKSLFYFALAATVFDVEQDILKSVSTAAKQRLPPAGGKVSGTGPATLFPTQGGFDRSQLQIPSLTIFAIEEPENHLSPHFLSRILDQVRSVVDTQMGQALLASHSPAILGRIDPTEVRHFRLLADSRKATVREIRLPDGKDEAAKYIREAVIAFPELYFAKFVILGEGASEEIILPRLAEALSIKIDRSFVAVVPLGGRHVNHFWRLLAELDIPHATLLDLDLGRKGAGWSRIKYACEQLLANGMKLSRLLQIGNEPRDRFSDQDALLTNIAKRQPSDKDGLDKWLMALEKVGVFFSRPLDVDFAMLYRFTSAYKATIVGDGPRVVDQRDPTYTESIENAANSVLGDSGAAFKLYTPQQRDLFPWYRYLFKTKGKPATHLIALSELSDQELASHAPPVLTRLLQYVENRIES